MLFADRETTPVAVTLVVAPTAPMASVPESASAIEPVLAASAPILLPELVSW
jgi:hypothetical protein